MKLQEKMEGILILLLGLVPFIAMFKHKETVEKPTIIYPQNITLHVKPDVEVKLECKATSGSQDTEEISIYWTVNQVFIESYPQLQQNVSIKMRDGKIHGKCTLFIPKVSPEFFGVPIQCTVLSPSGYDIGLVWLVQEDKITPTILLIAVPLILAVGTGAILFIFFKIDIMLAYRHLSGNVTNHEGKLYNAFVFYLNGNSPNCSATKELALRTLPEVLEQKHDLNLFIYGRDDSSTVSTAEISDVLSQSRSVVLILPGFTPVSLEDEILLSPGQKKSQVTDYFTAIAQSGLPLILVESEKNADYSLLPEPIQSLGRQEGVLKWRQTAQPNGRFWKQLRYRIT